MATTDIIVGFVDGTAEKATSIIHMPGLVDPTTLAALLTVLDGISVAGITKLTAITKEADVVGAASESDYDDAADKLQLNFVGTNGAKYQIAVPAPDPTFFNADKETVNLATAQTYIDVLTANCKDSAGGALTFVSGYRTRTRRKS